MEETEYPEMEEMVSTALSKSIPVCAICGATTFLCRKGFLNEIRHTGDSREWFDNFQLCRRNLRRV